jgi:hypothetical protein
MALQPWEFDKGGRLFIQAGNLVIKIDVFQSYVVPTKDLQRLLNGEIVDIRTRGNLNFVGAARPSASGRCLNFRIGERFYTVPYKNFRAVIEGKARKAAVFAGNGGNQ